MEIGLGVRLKTRAYCVGCPHFAPVAERMETKELGKYTRVSCKHEAGCEWAVGGSDRTEERLERVKKMQGWFWEIFWPQNGAARPEESPVDGDLGKWVTQYQPIYDDDGRAWRPLPEKLVRALVARCDASYIDRRDRLAEAVAGELLPKLKIVVDEVAREVEKECWDRETSLLLKVAVEAGKKGTEGAAEALTSALTKGEGGE